jgi:glycosyltransferase involved in cell wall biosynthesis
MKLVSIVIPVYKVEKYLSECLDSVIVQTYSDLQIILIDDGSPDNCGAICDEYVAKDDRITVIHSENGGLSAARNRGLVLCEGKYVFFVDSDDFLEPNAVELLVQTAESNRLDVLLYDAISFDETNDDVLESEINKYIRKNNYSAVRTGAQMFLDMLGNDEYRSPVQYYFYNREFLTNHLLTFHEGILHEDEEFNFFALLKAKRVKHIPGVLYHHRFRADSIMGTKSTQRNIDSCYEIIRQFMAHSDEFLSNTQTAAAYKKGLARMIRVFYYRVGITTEDQETAVRSVNELQNVMKQVDYYHDSEIKCAALNKEKKDRVKQFKMWLYPKIAPVLHRE